MIITVDNLYKYMVSVEREEIMKSLRELLWLQIYGNRKEAKRNSQEKKKPQNQKQNQSDTRVLKTIWKDHGK